MPKQQSKRRHKQYDPGSAYAGDVKPTGVLGFLGSKSTVRIIFVVMALALAAGGGAALFGSNLGGSGGHQSDGGSFDVGDTNTSVEPNDEPEVEEEEDRFAVLPALTIDPTKSYVATITTADGEILVQLFADQAPQTVNNFVFLAEEGFYDGLAFHDVAPGFQAQAGGSSSVKPTYSLPVEDSTDFEKGTLGMASTSVFFIALSGSETNAQEYSAFTSFGQITSGLEIAEQLAQGTAIQSISISEG